MCRRSSLSTSIKTRQPKEIPDARSDDLFAMVASGEAEEVAEKLRQVNLDTMTPLEAMNLVYQLKKILSSGNR